MKKPQSQRKPIPVAPIDLPIGKTYKDIEVHNTIVSEAFNNNVMIQCPYCARTFLEERYEIHSRSCTEDHPHKPPPSKQI